MRESRFSSFSRLFLHILRHAGGFDLLAQLLDIALALVLLAEFLLDRLHLLAQIVVALRLLHLVLHLGLDLVAQLLDFELLGQMLVERSRRATNVRGLQQLLLLVGGQKRQRGGDEVHQPARIFNVQRDRLQLVRQGRRRGDDLLELRGHVAMQCLQLRPLARGDLGHRLHRGGHERLKSG